MYSKAKKILGQWVVLLDSDANNAAAKPQFRSMSRKLASAWSVANEPTTPAYQLNATTGANVWRARAAN